MAIASGPSFFLLKQRLTAAESADILGRVTRQFWDPTFDYTPISLQTSNIIEKYKQEPLYDDNAIYTASTNQDDKWSAKVKGLLSLSKDLGDGGTVQLISPRVITRRLKLERDYFNELKKIPEVRKKIIEMCPIGAKASYLVVGTLSVGTAQFERIGKKHNVTNLQGSLPLGQVAATANAVLAPGSKGTVQLDSERTHVADWTKTFETTVTGKNGQGDDYSEEVFAIAYKEIARTWVGLGKDVELKARPVEFRGGQHFGDSDDSEADSIADDEEAQVYAATGISLTDRELPVLAADPDTWQELVVDPKSRPLFSMYSA